MNILKNKWVKISLSIILSISFSGCVQSAENWAHPSKNQNEMQLDFKKCEYEAMKNYRGDSSMTFNMMQNDYLISTCMEIEGYSEGNKISKTQVNEIINHPVVSTKHATQPKNISTNVQIKKNTGIIQRPSKPFVYNSYKEESVNIPVKIVQEKKEIIDVPVKIVEQKKEIVKITQTPKSVNTLNETQNELDLWLNQEIK